MRELTIAAALLAGCASIAAPAPGQSTRAAQFAAKNQEITARERECKERAKKQAHDELVQTNAVANPQAESRMKLANERMKQRLEMCKADAARANNELSEEERAEYQSQEQEARDHAALVRSLLASPVH